MSEETTMQHNADCANDKHNEHLCYLQYEGYHLSNRPEYKALVRDARYICRNCGRTAGRAANLCDPIEL